MRLLLVLLVACSSPPRDPTLANTSTRPAIDERAAITRIVLENFAADEKSIPDAGLLPATGPIYVLADVDEFRLTETMLPVHRRPFKLVTLADVQREANAAGASVKFIRFYELIVRPDATASVSYGVDLELPDKPGLMKTCCCTTHEHWDKSSGRWAPTPNAEKLGTCG